MAPAGCGVLVMGCSPVLPAPYCIRVGRVHRPSCGPFEGPCDTLQRGRGLILTHRVWDSVPKKGRGHGAGPRC